MEPLAGQIHMSGVTPTSPGFPLTMGSAPTSSHQFAGPSSTAGSPRSRPTTPISAGFIPPGPTYDELGRWEDTDVAAWLSAARLGHYAATFAENDIRGSVLLDVDQAALKEMGITMVKDRVRISAAIKLLNKRCADAAIARRPSVASLPPLLPLASHPLYGNEGEIEYLQHDHPADPGAEGLGSSFGINSMSMRRGQMRPPPLTLKQSTSRGMPGYASPANPLNNSQGFGLSAARGLTPGAARGSVWNTAASSSSPSKPGTAEGALHRKVNSIGSVAAPAIVGATSSLSTSRHALGHNNQNGRPSTATGASGYSSVPGSHPPRGGLTSSSPTSASFGSGISSNSGRPSTATGAQTYTSSIGTPASAGRDGYSPLTPISESNSRGTTPTTPSAIQQQQPAGYSVGRGPFASSQRYATSSGSSHQQPSSGGAIRRIDSGEGYNVVSTQLAGYQNPNPPTLEDLKRRTIKFISEEDNTTRIVNVSDCRDAYDVMARVLKKFGKPPSGNSYTPTADQGPTGDELGATETWGIFATSADGQNTKALSDNELLAICHAPQPHDPLRERGLTLRRIPNHLPGEDARKVPVRSGRNKLEAFFGERMPVAQMQTAGPSSGTTGEEEDAGSVTISGKKMKRASTVSIMSGLGVGPFSSSSSSNHHNTSQAVQSNSTKADSKHATKKETKNMSPTTLTSKPSKIRNFFGQRPPSELINTNLADFFPSTDSKALQRTARRSIYGRASASTRSKRNSTWSFVADPDAPPLPNKESLDGHTGSQTPLERSSASVRDRSTMPVIQIGYDSRSEDDRSNNVHGSLVGSPSHMQQSVAGPPTLPPVIVRDSLDEWSRDLKAVGSPASEFSSTFQSSKHSHGSHSLHPHNATQHSSLQNSGYTGRPSISRRASGESARSRRSLASQVRHGLSAARERNADAVSLLTVDEITQEVENRRESISLAGAGGGWVVDEDGVPIPIPGGSSARSSSAAASTRPSSGVSSSQIHGSSHMGHVGHGEDDESDEEANQSSDLEGPPRTTKARSIASKAASIRTMASNSAERTSSVLQAPGDESDRHLGDPMAVARSTTSRASSVSELRNSMDDHDDLSDISVSDFSDSDIDSDGTDTDDDDQGTNVYLPPANKAPIKWHKGALIGAGSFGNVFLGMNAKTGLLMAVKQVELPSGDSHLDQRKKGMLEALEREIKLLKTLEHENIVQYLDSFADGSHLNIFLEYVPGGSIVALLRNYGAFEEPLVRNFVRQILKGLSFLHNRGIMHRDIKGANILVDNKGGIKISDFGISKKVESDLVLATNKGGGGVGGAGGAAHRPSLQGSVFWMAPEVVKQTSYTIKADIWSLGCLVVEMISGTHPWAELNQMQALFQIGMGRKPSLPDEISNECRDFLEKTFELDYNDRPSADELLNHGFMGSEMTFSRPADGDGADDDGPIAAGSSAGAGGAARDGGDVDATLAGDEAETATNATRETKEGKRPTRSKSTRRLERERRHKEATAAAAAVAESGTPNTPTGHAPAAAMAVSNGGTVSSAVPAEGGDASSPATAKATSASTTAGGMVDSVSTSSIATARGNPVPPMNTEDSTFVTGDPGSDPIA